MNQNNRFDPPQPFAQQGPQVPGQQGQGNPYPQQFQTVEPPKPKKSWFARHKVLTTLGAIIMVFAIGSAIGGGGDDQTPKAAPAASANTAGDNQQKQDATPEQSPDETPEEAPPAEPKGFQIGDVANVGDMTYKIVSVNTASEVGPSFSVTKAKGTFVVVKIEVTNNANEAAMVDSSFFKLKSGEKSFEADSMASLWANTSEDGNNGSFILENLNPDLTMSGVVVFDVSDTVATAADNVLVAQTGFWGTESVDILLAQ
ncbi:DUF4352 domain-containing protein [Jonesiaceae bacterium BS-20]|uniref:DUF4352 domain-containing protein n=1 Tax=Jonesiaceae bacterium BS-20 TaxID=3120821 RepID=A0AAU7DTD3_9MICO